jgi:mannitol-1-phosphate/altronate dehydrogenase
MLLLQCLQRGEKNKNSNMHIADASVMRQFQKHKEILDEIHWINFKTVNSKSASMSNSYRHDTDNLNQFTSLRVNRFENQKLNHTALSVSLNLSTTK